MNIYAKVDLSDFIDEIEEKLSSSKDLFDDLVCGTEGFYNKNRQYLIDYNLPDEETEELWKEMDDAREKYLDRYKKNTIKMIIDIIKDNEN